MQDFTRKTHCKTGRTRCRRGGAELIRPIIDREDRGGRKTFIVLWTQQTIGVWGVNYIVLLSKVSYTREPSSPQLFSCAVFAHLLCGKPTGHTSQTDIDRKKQTKHWPYSIISWNISQTFSPWDTAAAIGEAFCVKIRSYVCKDWIWDVISSPRNK